MDTGYNIQQELKETGSRKETKVKRTRSKQEMEFSKALFVFWCWNIDEKLERQSDHNLQHSDAYAQKSVQNAQMLGFLWVEPDVAWPQDSTKEVIFFFRSVTLSLCLWGVKTSACHTESESTTPPSSSPKPSEETPLP